MDSFEKLKDDIVAHAGLDRKEASGWYSLQCPVCKNTRKTGGFLLEDDHIIFKCFRASCPSDTGLEREGRVSKKFKEIMKELGVTIPIDLLTHKSKIKQELESVDDHLFKEHSYKSIHIKDQWVPLLDDAQTKNYFAKRWVRILSERRLDLSKVSIFKEGDYFNFPFVRFFHHNKLIGYQIITNNKYITITEGNSNLVYLPDGRVPDPCIIVEGIADALVFPNTVAILGNRLSREQAYILRTAKKWIFLPDRSGNAFLEQSKQYNQPICIPEWKVNDLNEAVNLFGKFIVAKKMHDGLLDNHMKAEIKYKLWKQES